MNLSESALQFSFVRDSQSYILSTVRTNVHHCILRPLFSLSPELTHPPWRPCAWPHFPLLSASCPSSRFLFQHQPHHLQLPSWKLEVPTSSAPLTLTASSMELAINPQAPVHAGLVGQAVTVVNLIFYLRQPHTPSIAMILHLGGLPSSRRPQSMGAKDTLLF